MTPQSSSSTLETEYLQLKRLLYEKFFTYMMYAGLMAFIVESIRAIVFAKVGIVAVCVFMVISGVFFTRFIHGLDKNKEQTITIFLIVFYTVCLVAQYHGDTGYFSNPLDSFYFAYTSAIFDRLIVSRIPKANYRTTWYILTTLFRLIVIPVNDKGMFVAQFISTGASIFLDLDKEKHDQNLFKFYFDSKDQLMKFKNLVVDDIPEEILIISRDLMQCLFVNKSFQRLVGLDPNASIRTQLKQFLLQESLEQATVNKDKSQSFLRFLESYTLQADQNNSKTSCNLVTRSSSDKEKSYIFEAKIFNITWDGQQAITIVLNNLTQQQTIFNLKAASVHKDAVLATVSHELRTPLNGMLGMIQIMQKHITDSQMIRYLRICKNNGELLLSLVNSILDLNQITSNKLKLFNEKINIYELLQETLSLFEYQCNQKGLYLRLQVAPETPKVLLTDMNRLKQILINLIGNALKFTIEGGLTISAAPSQDGNYIKFSVKDTGIGIKENDRHKLFRVFGKLEQDNTSINKHGVGLGLTISNNLAKVLCANEPKSGIEVESEFNKGSIFSFTIKKNIEELSVPSSSRSIPMSHMPEDIPTKIRTHLTLPIKKPIHSLNTTCITFFGKQISSEYTHITTYADSFPSRMHTGQELNLSRQPRFFSQPTEPEKPLPYILVVDDNPFNLAVAEHLIKNQGYRVKTALYGQAAIDLMLNNNHKKDPMALILMDCQMPVMDGYETTRLLIKLMKGKKIPEIPIVSLTANDSEADKKICKEAGMCDHLSKPLQEVDLQRMLRKYGNC